MREIRHVSSGQYVCSFPDCQASYDKEWKLEAHLCKHTGVKPFKCEYDGCCKSFCTKFHLSRHELTHTGERPYKCGEEGCTESFTTNSNLKKHISRKHKLEVKLYICTFEGCGKSFKKNNLLKIHESEHTLQLPYKCSYEGCDKHFGTPSKQKRHEKVHKGYPCQAEKCSFIGKTWTELTKHRKEHIERVQCEVCNKMFRDRWFLKQHERIHSEVRTVFYCPREDCTRSYTTAFNLQSHILSFHEEERSFTCTHPGCGRSFSMRQSLQRHCVVHDPERKKQTKPRPTRSLASRLSGYKPPKKSQSETSAPEPTQSVTSQSALDLKSEPRINEERPDLTIPPSAEVMSVSEYPEVSQSELRKSENSVIPSVAPHALVGPSSQSALAVSQAIGFISQSESSKSEHMDISP